MIALSLTFILLMVDGGNVFSKVLLSLCSTGKSLRPAVLRTAMQPLTGEYFGLPIAGPPTQLPVQADISIKQWSRLPFTTSSNTVMQLRMPSTASREYPLSRSTSMVSNMPPAVGKSRALPVSSLFGFRSCCPFSGSMPRCLSHDDKSSKVSTQSMMPGYSSASAFLETHGPIKITLLWGCAFFMVIPCASMGEATLARQGMAEGK